MEYDVRSIIGDSFLDLLMKKSFKEIKITELTSHAGINRSLFYYYFHIVDDVADYLLKQLNESINKYFTDTSDILFLLCNQTQESVETSVVVSFIKDIKKRKEIILIFSEDPDLRNRLEDSLLKCLKENLRDYDYAVAEDGQIYYFTEYERDFIIQTESYYFLGFIKYIAENNYAESEETVANIVRQMRNLPFAFVKKKNNSRSLLHYRTLKHKI